ncbi:MAG TPA: hypothetical protein VKS43_02905 [Burkholderiales bacterium]|jgi:hypothetical protein|nr:hypothetical protein [Burkholderiales bacterium]
MAADLAHSPSPQQRRVRRAALLWALIAAGFYFGFIVLTLVRASR